MKETATSLEIAKFRKNRHADTMRDIKKLIKQYPELEECLEIRWVHNEVINRKTQHYIISGELLKIFRLKYIYKVRMHSGKVKEPVALATIEQIKGVKLERQYLVKNPCGSCYRIDGYDTINNIAYEIDEEYHTYQREEDYEREQFIREYLGCEFVRIKV